MKIWVVGRGYPTPANRMWGVFELEQAKLLARNGHDVSYIALTLSFFSRKDPRGMRIFEEDGVKIYTCSKLYFPGKAGFYWERYEDRCWQELFSKAEEKGIPDLIHIHYPAMICSVNLAEKYRAGGVRIYATEHWSRVLINNLKEHELARLRYYATHASCFACVGKPLQEAVQKLVNVTVPMTIIPNIVSPVFFRNEPAEEKDEFTFVCVGRFVPVKQFDAVIRQFKAEFKDRKNVFLCMIGSGPERKKLEAEADGRVTFTGGIGIEDVARHIAKADALVSFSQYETFAAPVAEAWAAGKPVIVSDKSGIASYVDARNGIVVPADSESLLGKAMSDLFNDRAKYDSDHMRSFAADHFSDTAIRQQLTNMYTEYQ